MKKRNFAKIPLCFNLEIAIYNVDVNVYIGNIKTKKGFNLLRSQMPIQRKNISKGDLRGAKGQCIGHSNGCSDIYIYCANFKKPDKLAETLTTMRHEVQHAAINIFNWIEDPNLQSEAFLYLNDFIYSKILAEFLSHAKK